MNIRALVLSLALVSLCGAASAADTNFAPANMSGSASASESKSRPAAAERTQAAAQREPGFWDREGKRSGLADTTHGFGARVKNFPGSVKNFFERKSEEYKQRNPGSDN